MERVYDPEDDRKFKELAANLRTDSGLPICFNCEKVGHTKKVCRFPRKTTKYVEKFQDRLNERKVERNFQDRGGMDRSFPERGMDRSFPERGMDRSFPERGNFQPKVFPERVNYLERSRDRSPIARPTRVFVERDARPYRRPSPPSLRPTSDTMRRLDALEADLRCERLEEHMRKLQDELLDLRAEARSSRMIQPRMMHRMPSPPRREEFIDDGPVPGVVKQLAKLLRTDDNQPICFECGRAGHTRRNCFLNN